MELSINIIQGLLDNLLCLIHLLCEQKGKSARICSPLSHGPTKRLVFSPQSLQTNATCKLNTKCPNSNTIAYSSILGRDLEVKPPPQSYPKPTSVV